MNAALNGTRRALRLGTGLATCVSCMVFAQSALAQSMPELSNAGGASISLGGNTLSIDALAADRVINWQTFSVASGNTVSFTSTDGIGNAVATPVTVINRVIGKDVGGTTTFFPSLINGSITATDNISLWLINPSGVLFGASGAFNGGSLVVSTLDFKGAPPGTQVFGPGDRTVTLASRDVVIDPGSALAAVELKLEGGAGALRSSGSVLLLGEQVTVGKTVAAQDDVYVVAASDVRITSRAGSPVGYAFAKGTRLNGAQVLASGNVEGRSIVLAASNGTSALADLLQVEAGSRLTVTQDGGSITLLTAAQPVTLGDPATGANIVSRGVLRSLADNADVTVQSNASALVERIETSGNVLVRSGAGASDTVTAGTIRSGGNVELRATGDLVLGTSGTQAIIADGKITLRSNADIVRGAGSTTLAIRSHDDPLLADGTMFISAQNVDLGNASLAGGSNGSASVTIFANGGEIAIGSAIASRFSATAATTFAATGLIRANNSAVGAGTALSISAADGIELGTAQTTGTDQDISLNTAGTLAANSISASRNVIIGNSLNPVGLVDAGTLTAQNGNLTVIADEIDVGSASAGQSVNLRSDGDIAVSGGLIAGTAAMSTGNITVSGITGSRAASFAAGAVNATTGQATVRADAQTIGSLRSATASTLDATGAVSLGSATVGGNLAVTSTGGDISLGTSGAQSIVANGRVTITATAGAIGRGAGSSALTVRSNDDDLGAADSLTLRAGNAVALGNAALNGGRTGTAAVSVRSDTAGVALGSALGSSFAGSAATTFAASGSILANTATATGGDTIAITGLGGIDVQTVRTGGGSGQNIVLTSNGPISATTLDAQNNLIIASLANPAASLTATTLTARDGSISAFAGSMALGSASAGQSVNLRSNGAIGVTGSVTAGTDLAVAGLTNARAASFSAAQATATGGMLDIKAALVNIGNATSGADTLIDGATVVLGRATAGTLPASGNLVITASGDITLGTAAGALISASGGVSMTSSGGSILRGAGASNLTIRSNSDGAGSGPLALTATTGAIALDGATLKGGTAGQSAITLNSGADTLFSVADGAGFTATTGGNFTSTGSIKAAGAAQIAATGAASIAQVETTGAGNAISVTAASADIGRVASAGDYSVAATGNIALGRAGALSQAAAGLVNISAGGNISQGAASLTLTANSDGAGAETLALSAGGTIGLGGAWLVGGTGAQASAVSVTSGGNAVVDRITSAALTVSSGGSFTSDNRIDAVGDAVITASGAVTLNQIFASGSGHDLSITTPGAVNVFSAGAARNLTIGGSAGGNVASVVAGNLFAVSGSVRVRATSSDITDIYAGNNVTVSGASAIIGNVAAGLSNPGGSLSINATGNVTLGKTAGNTQLATGAITVNAGGSITKGDAGLLTLTANSDGTGAEAMTLNAGGAIALAGARLNGGTAQQSAVSLSAGSSIRIERATSAAFTATAGTSFTADNDIVALGNAAITAGGPVALRAVTANGANNDITVVTPGAVAALSLTAARNVTVEGPSGSSAASFTAGSVTATAGAISVRAGATDIGSATSGTNTTVSGTTAALGIVSSGGNYTVSTTGDVTLGKFAGQTQSARGAIAITSTGGSIRQGATGLLTMTANSDGVGTETLALSAGSAIALGGAQLNGGTNRQSAVNLTSVGNTEIAGANASAFTATAGTASAQAAFTANRAVRAATNMTITANGKVTLGDGGSAGNAVRISARDATIGDDLSAATIELFNTAPSGSTIIGGTAESIAGNFVLDRNEAARLKATGTLTLGADAAHDVEIRQVNFTVPSTVQVLARGKRIDVTGRITFDADTVLKLGSFGAAAADQTSIIRLNSQAGGAIYSPGGVLELSAANIAAGNNEFGTALNAQASGTGAGTGSIAEAIKLNLNPGSPLYTSANGGGAAMIETGSMKVTFSGFAMFQNTNNIDGSKGAINLLSTGVTLGGGNALALDIVSGAAQPVFALFGSVNGIVNAATALLGNPPIGRYTNVSASRINGCIIGGGSCNSVQNLTPSLTGLENIRTTIFTVKPDFVVPFDPLVGTNNDALFDDVGSFGLGELPMTPIECSDPNGSCDVQKKDGK